LGYGIRGGKVNYSIAFAQISQIQTDSNSKKICKIMRERERHIDVERQAAFSNVS
jgi:hypothetical protein